MRPPSDPVRQLPTPAQVHAHIGRLLRELRLAKQLYRVVKAAELEKTVNVDRRDAVNA